MKKVRNRIMNGVLNVSTDKLTSTAASFQSTGSTVNNLTQQMTGIVTSLSGQIWSGSAATQYVAKFNGLQDDIGRMIAMINEHVEDLQQMAADYESVESANEGLIGNLSSDVIV